MTFDELFAQVRLELGPQGDNVEVLLMMVEEGLAAYFHPDAAWMAEPLRRCPTIRLYQEVVSALGEGLAQLGNSSDRSLPAQTAEVAEGFRRIISRVTRQHLERLPITSPKPL